MRDLLFLYLIWISCCNAERDTRLRTNANFMSMWLYIWMKWCLSWRL